MLPSEVKDISFYCHDLAGHAKLSGCYTIWTDFVESYLVDYVLYSNNIFKKLKNYISQCDKCIADSEISSYKCRKDYSVLIHPKDEYIGIDFTSVKRETSKHFTDQQSNS